MGAWSANPSAAEAQIKRRFGRGVQLQQCRLRAQRRERSLMCSLLQLLALGRARFGRRELPEPVVGGPQRREPLVGVRFALPSEPH
jgi:hypothetical protein